jgi:hypothetical protein
VRICRSRGYLVRRRLLLPFVLLVLAGVSAGAATGSAPGAQHAVYSDHWQSTTFVGGLESCPLFGPTSASLYEFDDVDLRDHIESRYTPLAEEPLYRIDSVGSVHGMIDAPDGIYRISGAGLKEHRTDQLVPLYFSGVGHVSISGPRGTVAGTATFQDLIAFPPPEFDVLFTSVTTCHLS